MNILVAANDGFVFPTSALLQSLKDSHERDCGFQVYVLCSSLTKESIRRFNLLNDERMRIHFVQVEDRLFENVPLYSYFSKEVYYRLAAQDLLSVDIERILWLDGDIIVKGSLNEFYFQDFEGNLWVAQEDMINGRSKRIHKKLSIPMEYDYCSSGVMLCNMSLLRQKVNVKDIFKYISNHRDIMQIVDQDALNAIFYKDIKVWKAPYTYNHFAGHITRKNRREVMETCAVVHYCGPYKPWKKNYPYYGFELFWKYAIDIEEGREIYNRIKMSCKISHAKWRLYEEIKTFVGHFISMEKLNEFLGRKQNL